MAEKLDIKYQLVETKPDLNQITTFKIVFANGDYIIKVF